ncbi:MAG: hypothetical protein Q9180_003908 [Flavoplaca navasiana]
MSTHPPTPSNSSGSRSSSSEFEIEVKRRRLQDDRGGALTPPPENRMAQEGFCVQKYRVGQPPLQILPLNSTFISDDHPAAIFIRTKLPVFNFTCVHWKVDLIGENYDAFELVHRTLEDEAPSPNNMTLCVKANWTEGCTHNWSIAVSALRSVLSDNPATRTVRVEMISWQLYRPRFTEPLEGDHPIVHAWPQIQPQIHTILNQRPVVKNAWQSIIVVRRGYIRPNVEDFGNADPPQTSVVLLIIMSYDVDPWQWAPEEHAIKRLLLQHGQSEVQLDIERGSNQTSTFPLRPPTKPDTAGNTITGSPYSFSIGLGADCGPAKYFELVLSGKPIAGPNGTVGGIVTVTKSDGTERKMALLNYHVARTVFEGMSFEGIPNTTDIAQRNAPLNSELANIDRNGLPAATLNSQDMLLESPSRKKHNYTMQDLSQSIADDQIALNATTDPADGAILRARLAENLEEYADKKKFFDDGMHHLGRPWLASGFTRRTGSNSRLDWALVAFDDDGRIGSNMVPASEHWPVPKKAPIDIAGKVLKGVTSCKNITALDEVFKVGSRTGLTRGEYSGIKVDVNLPAHDNDYGMGSSNEHCFVYKGSQPRPFADRGDSGAWIWTRGAKFVAQFHGGPRAETLAPGSLMYATDAEELFRDMNDMVGPDYTIALAT